MIRRLTVVTTLIALFALGFSALVDGAHQRSAASTLTRTGEGCLADGLLCAPGGGARR